MMRGVWNDVTVAETPRTKRVEGNHYFPPESLTGEYFTESPRRTLCPWEGVARYYEVTVDGHNFANAAWCHPHPSPLARKIKRHLAFSYGVSVEAVPEAGR